MSSRFKGFDHDGRVIAPHRPPRRRNGTCRRALAFFSACGAESRPWEALGMTLAPFLNSLMVGPAKTYRGIPADTVAAAMIAAAGTARTGQHIHTYADMMAPEGI